MKIVLSPSDVAHKFAHQLQDEARNSNNTFYFKGDTIYSYGSHFPIAKFVTGVNGDIKLLFQTRTYSNTTSNHVNIVRHATSHIDKIFAPFYDLRHTDTISHFIKNIEGHLHGLDKAKKPEKYISPAESEFSSLCEYCQFFGLELPKQATEIIEKAKSGQYKLYLIEKAEKLQAERLEREKQALKDHKKKLAKWRKGEGERLYSRTELVDYLRIGEKGRIETSQGVLIPAEVGRRTYSWILATLKTGGCIGDCEFKVLDFEVNSLTTTEVKIGCHTILLTEIKMIAKKLGW